MYNVRYGFNFIFFPKGHSVVQHHLFKSPPLLQWFQMPPLSYIKFSYVFEFIS